MDVLPKGTHREGGALMPEPHEQPEADQYLQGSINHPGGAGGEGEIIVPQQRGRQRQDPEIVSREQALDPATEFQVAQDGECVALTKGVWNDASGAHADVAPVR